MEQIKRVRVTTDGGHIHITLDLNININLINNSVDISVNSSTKDTLIKKEDHLLEDKVEMMIPDFQPTVERIKFGKSDD